MAKNNCWKTPRTIYASDHNNNNSNSSLSNSFNQLSFKFRCSRTVLNDDRRVIAHFECGTSYLGALDDNWAADRTLPFKNPFQEKDSVRLISECEAVETAIMDALFDVWLIIVVDDSHYDALCFVVIVESSKKMKYITKRG